MKTKTLLGFVCFIIVLTFAPTVNAQAKDKFVVVLDAGHGGKDPGNLGNGYREKDIALKVVLEVGKQLEKNPDIEVVYTRKTDVFVDLFVRGKIANKAKADLFVSVHCDSHTSQAYGAGTFVLGLHRNKTNFEVAKKARASFPDIKLAGPVANERGRWVIGVRHDRLRLTIDDYLQAGGIDNSGERIYNETNYSLGYSHTLDNRWSAFSQYATSFEAPTFTEFANPDGSGFRPGLEPQTSRSFEVGLRGHLFGYQLEATLFTVRVKDEIIVDDDPGTAPGDERTFYRNADRTRRDGLELGGRWWPRALPRLQLSGALTYMDARFDDASNNTLPGLPDWTAFIDAKYQFQQGYFAGLAAQYIGTRYADDLNTVEVPSQTVTDLRVGRKLSGWIHDAQLVIGIENLFNTEYLDNLRINARNARYYEPGAARRIYAGIEFSWI